MFLSVGTTNPAKLNAVQLATQSAWPDVTIQGFDVASGVPAQPMSDTHTKQGAQNRALAAYEVGVQALKNDEKTDQVWGVGLEGGITELNDGWYNTVWVSVYSPAKGFTDVNGSRFRLEQALVDEILSGKEMGQVVGQWMNDADVNKKDGFIGYVTGGVVTRSQEYAHLLRLALGIACRPH